MSEHAIARDVPDTLAPLAGALDPAIVAVLDEARAALAAEGSEVNTENLCQWLAAALIETRRGYAFGYRRRGLPLFVRGNDGDKQR